MRNGGAAPDPSTQFSLFRLYMIEHPTLPKLEKDIRKARGIVKSLDFSDIHGLIFNTINEKEEIYKINIYDSYNE